MKFISRHKNLKVVLRPTIKYVANNNSGSEEILKYPPIIIEFRSGLFDTVNWQNYCNDDIPAKLNIVKSEKDLINLLTKNEFYNVDFSALKEESKEEKRSRLLNELAQLDGLDGNGVEQKKVPSKPSKARKSKGAEVKKDEPKKEEDGSSVVDL